VEDGPKRRWTNQIEKEKVNRQIETKSIMNAASRLKRPAPISDEEMELYKYKWELAKVQQTDGRTGA